MKCSITQLEMKQKITYYYMKWLFTMGDVTFETNRVYEVFVCLLFNATQLVLKLYDGGL